MNQIKLLSFSDLSKFSKLKQGTFTRKGGPSEGLNFGHELVNQSLKKVEHFLGAEKVISGHQVHGIRIAEITSSSESVHDGVDGFMTNEPGVCLLIKHADCQAAVLYDPVQGAIGNVHCGWKGNVQNIYEHMVNAMGERYGTHPKDLWVAVSPSLGPCHAQFINYRTELPEIFWKHKNESDHFDLWAVARDQFESIGIPSDQIEISRRCTYADAEDFFSYRRDRTTDRNGTVIMLTS